MACVNIFSFSLQVLRHLHPEWMDSPLVVVETKRPDALIRAANKPARCAGIKAGMKLSEASALRSDLRARRVEADKLHQKTREALEVLKNYSPFVRPVSDRCGLFWIDVSGLDHLFESYIEWAKSVFKQLENDANFYATVVVGFTQFGTYTIARALRGIMCFETRQNEFEALCDTSIDHLDISPDQKQLFGKLGIETIGAFLKLSPSGLQKRFGKRLQRIHRAARQQLSHPLESEFAGNEAATRHITLPYEETDISGLIFHIKFTLNQILDRTTRDEGIKSIDFEFIRSDESTRTVQCRWAEPKRDLETLSELIRLRLERIDFDRKNPQSHADSTLDNSGAHRENAALTGCRIDVDLANSESSQLPLLESFRGRSHSQAKRALYKIQAELGEHSVVRAKLTAGIRPEKTFEWEPFDTLNEPDITPDQTDHCLVRRIWRSNLRWREMTDDCVDFETPPPDSFRSRPQIISGGWWSDPFYRIYRYCQIPNGPILWVYYDKRDESWFVQGRIE